MSAPLLHEDSTRPLRSPKSPDGKPVWRVGTLTYTAGALGMLFFWLLWGDFAWSLKERSVTAIVQLLLRRFEASDLLVGLLIGSIPSLLNLVVTPIVSYRSDRHRSRWGRRIPFLAIPTPIAALAMIGLAFCPPIGASLHEFLGHYSPGVNIVTLWCFAFFWMIFEVATVVANAVLVALINDVVPAALLGRFQGLFRALSLIAGIIFNYWIFARAETHYHWIFITIGTVYGLGFLLMCINVKEGEYPYPTEEDGNRAVFSEAVKIYFKESFSRSFYIWIFMAMNLPMLAFVPVNIYSVYFAKSVGMTMDLYGKCIAITFAISLTMSYFIGWLADRFHPVRVGMVAAGLYAAVTLMGSVLATTSDWFSVALIAHGVLAGTWMTATASLGQRLYPKARFAQFASAQAMIYSLGIISITPVVGSFLDYTGRDYRFTLLIAGSLAAIGAFSTWVLLRRMEKARNDEAVAVR